MTGLHIALVGAPEWAGIVHARRALHALAEVEISHLPPGATPTADLDGIWLLAPPADAAPDIHDQTISWALHLGLPLVGPLGPGEGGPLRAVPDSRMAQALGTGPVELPTTESGVRGGADYLAPAGTVWVAEAHRGEAPAVVTAAGSPFVTLLDHPLATDAGLHPVLPDFVAAARARQGARLGLPAPAPASAPMVPPTTGATFAPLPDDEPRSYVHQMRTEGYRWWRPLLGLAVGVGTFVVLSMALSILWIVLDPSLLETSGDVEEADFVAPVPMLIGNLMLAALIPATLIATRVGHWRPMGKLWSVTGRIRWRWLGIASLVTLLVWGGYLLLMWALDGGASAGDPPPHWPWLVVITLLTTPLQAAGEEVAFRGGLMQGVGAWIKNPVVALVVGTVLSAALFALAHTSLDPWILIDLGGMAVACCYLTWRTGGLEAAIVLHVVNNLVLIILLTLFGGLEDAYVTDQTTSTVGVAGISVFATAIMTAILLWLARRSGIAPKKLGAPATNSGSPQGNTHPPASA